MLNTTLGGAEVDKCMWGEVEEKMIELAILYPLVACTSVS